MKKTRFVIVADSPHQVAPGSCFIAKDGSLTILRSKAARFDSFADARQFAEAHHITLNGHTYIGLEEFIDFDKEG